MGSLTGFLNEESLQAAMQDERLRTLLYQDLRVIAHAKLRGQSSRSELDTTSLVHEAYLKLSPSSSDRQWNDRHHFYATAALAMRQIVVDVARHRLADKRANTTSITSVGELPDPVVQECAQVVALNDALEHLKTADPGLVEVVNLRYFVGMTVAEIATIMSVSKRTVDREWQKAKALLRAFMSD